MKTHFPEGRLQGNRPRLKFIVPAHKDLDVPQLTPSSGLAIFWGIAFLGYRPAIVRLELGSSFSSPSSAQ